MNAGPSFERSSLAAQAWEIWDHKAKPQLSLGRLERLVVDIVCMRGELLPELGTPCLLLFAADHGIVEEHVSSSPREITWQQCVNFANGGGAIALLCKSNGIDLRVIDVGVAHEFDRHLAIMPLKIAMGTKNFARHSAMTESQLHQALDAGTRMVAQASADGHVVVAFGEMGIGNTSSSSAVMASLTRLPIELCTGRGAGLSDEALAHKRTVIEAALALHGYPRSALEALRLLGGFEIAAIAGGMLEAARHKMVILVDGFIATTSALVATMIDPRSRSHMIFCHESDEGGHHALLQFLDAEPLLSLSMRLGEGTGAAICWPLIRQAVDLYLHMTSFDTAGVTNSVARLKAQGVDAHG